MMMAAVVSSISERINNRSHRVVALLWQQQPAEDLFAVAVPPPIMSSRRQR